MAVLGTLCCEVLVHAYKGFYSSFQLVVAYQSEMLPLASVCPVVYGANLVLAVACRTCCLTPPLCCLTPCCLCIALCLACTVSLVDDTSDGLGVFLIILTWACNSVLICCVAVFGASLRWYASRRRGQHKGKSRP